MVFRAHDHDIDPDCRQCKAMKATNLRHLTWIGELQEKIKGLETEVSDLTIVCDELAGLVIEEKHDADT